MQFVLPNRLPRFCVLLSKMDRKTYDRHFKLLATLRHIKKMCVSYQIVNFHGHLFVNIKKMNGLNNNKYKIPIYKAWCHHRELHPANKLWPMIT